MLVLNCTKKLAKRLSFEFAENPGESTNKLGPWTANSFNIGRFPMIILTNDKTLLTTVIPLKETRTFHDRFLMSLELLFQSIALSSAEILSELQEMSEMQFTTRTSRSVLGSMNDFVFHARVAINQESDLSLPALSFELSSIPCSPLKYGYPREAALDLLAPPPSRMLRIHSS